MEKKSLYSGHRDRLRQRFDRVRSDGLLEYELLELLLTYSIPRRDVKPIAKNLLNQFTNISGIMDADKNELTAVDGVGAQSVTLISLVKELCIKYFEDRTVKRDVLSDPKCVIDFARVKLAGLACEVFMIIYLNTKNEALHHEVLYEGTIDQAIVYPRRIVEGVLHNRAAGIIIFHNHPSGHCAPSAEDKVITRKIKDCLLAVDVNLLDHVIVAKEGYFSFQEDGLL